MGHPVATTGAYAFSARAKAAAPRLATTARLTTTAASSKASSCSRSLPSGACSVTSRHLNRLLSYLIFNNQLSCHKGTKITVFFVTR
jgi:hypothetical protein